MLASAVVAPRPTAALAAASPRSAVSLSSSRCSLRPASARIATRALLRAQGKKNAPSFPALVVVAAAAASAGGGESTTTTTATSVPSLADATPYPVADEATLSLLPATSPCVYAVSDDAGAVQYVGMSRRLPATVAGHAASVKPPTKASTVKFAALPAAATREQLTDAWRSWVQQVVDASGAPPPGNLPDQQATWAPKTRAAPPPPPEIKLTPGKGIEDLTVPVETLIAQVVADHHVVAFVKGTRREPQCGFSHSVLTMLTAACSGSAAGGASQTTFQVVNVLDEQFNPGLRDAIKAFSQWPTIPQVYIGGEFVGGADIVAELASSGELAKMVKKKE